MLNELFLILFFSGCTSVAAQYLSLGWPGGSNTKAGQPQGHWRDYGSCPCQLTVSILQSEVAMPAPQCHLSRERGWHLCNSTAVLQSTGLCAPPACITSQAWSDSAVVEMEEEKRWGLGVGVGGRKQEGRRNTAQERSTKLQPQSK